MKRNDVIKYIIFAALGVLIIYFIQERFNFDKFIVNVKKTKIEYVILSVSIGVFAVFIRGLRWKLLLEPLGYTNTSLSNAYHATMSGYLVNLGIPRSGEVYRCAVFSKTDNVPVNVLVGTVLSERILDLVMLMFVILGTIFTQFDLLYNYIDTHVISLLRENKLLLVILIIIAIAGLVLVFKARSLFKPESKIGKMFLGFFDGIKSIFTLKRPFLFIIYTIAIWVCYWMMTYSLLLAFDFTAQLGMLGGLSTLVFSSLGIIVPVPAGFATVGSIELGLEQIYNVAESQANSVAIVMFFSNIAMIILAGTISYIVMAKRTKA